MADAEREKRELFIFCKGIASSHLTEEATLEAGGWGGGGGAGGGE